MRVLVYDGDCAMCEATSRCLVAAAGAAPERRRPHLAFEGEAFERLRAAGVHDEMAVLDEATGEVRSGVAGVLWWLRDTRLRAVARALDRPLVRALLTPPYRLVAYDRRVIAPPPPRPLPCACDPSPHPGYQTAFALLLAAVGAAGLVSALASLSSAVLDRSPARLGPLAALAAAPAVAAALAASRAPPGRRLTALGHGLWPFAAAAPAFLLGEAAFRMLTAPVGAVVRVGAFLAGAVVLVRSVVRRRRVLASWRR